MRHILKLPVIGLLVVYQAAVAQNPSGKASFLPKEETFYFADTARYFEKTTEMRLILGTMRYNGDLSNDQLANTKGLKPAAGLFVRRHLWPNLALRGNLLFGKIAANDLDYTDPNWRQQRKYAFETKVTELSLQAEWDIFGKKRFRRTDTVSYELDRYRQIAHVNKFKPTLAPYLFAGGGLVITKANTLFDQPYLEESGLLPKAVEDLRIGSKTQNEPTLAFGAGVNLDLSRRWMLGLELGARSAFSDYFDGVSQSGNPDKPDWYWLVGVNVDWIGKRKWAYLFSGALTVIGIASFATRGFELGVDFKGGYSFNVQFDRPVEEGQLRSSLNEAFGGNPIVKAVSTENTYNITTSYLINEQGPTVVDQVTAKLHEGIQKAGFDTKLEDFKNTDGKGTHITSSSQVGPTVADDIRSSSIQATIWGLLAIFIYLLIRFRKWQFSIGAVLALFHDVIITLSFFSLLHGLVPFSLEIDQAIIACILTVIGFSVNDTVIVYDRIREFINTYAGRPKEEVFNLAINTTLSRTLITSGTIIAVVLLLFLFGGGALKGFSFGMLVGMIFGTYSSVFIASALVVDFTKEKVITGQAVEAKPAPAATKAKATAK